MAKFHFVEDYEAHVERLLAAHSIDEAMSLAVGGRFHEIGEIEKDILKHAGLQEGMALVDIGCGSGRLAHVLGESMSIDYLGTDIVQSLLDYAATKCPGDYQFTLHRELSVPAEDASADMVSAFSVFTHLLHEETYIYLEDSRRVLKKGGRLVFSFLEFGSGNDIHWPIFADTVQRQRTQTLPALNMFIERNAIAAWCAHLGYEIVEIISGNDAPYAGDPLGQSTAILRKS